MKSIVISSFILILGSTAFGQAGKLKRADANYNTLCYALAAAQYQELIGSEVDSPQLKSKLAFCYFQLGDMTKASALYGQIAANSSCNSEDLFYYALTLKETGNYSESDKWMRLFAQKMPNDLRAKAFANDANYLQGIQQRGAYFSIDKVAINSVFSDFGGYSTVDGKATYFLSTRTDRTFVNRIWSWNNARFLDVYSASRDSVNQLSNSKLVERSINSRFHEGPLCFSPDGRKVFFTRNNIQGTKRDQKGIQNLKLYVADVQEGKWINEREFSLNSSEYSVGHPSISADGKFLYFASDMPGGFGGADIYRVALNDDGTVGKPENLGAQVNTEAQELFPWINQEGLLFFSSNGHIGLGGLDVFVVLPAANGKRTQILNVGMPLNSAQDDFGFTMVGSTNYGYFSTNRMGGKGDDDVYSIKQLKPFVSNLKVNGTALDQTTNRPIPGAKIELLDVEGNVVASVIADQNGAYVLPVDVQSTYTIVATKGGYMASKTPFSTNGLPVFAKEMKVDTELAPAAFELQATVKDGNSGQLLTGVLIEIKDAKTGKVIVRDTTGSKGSIAEILSSYHLNDTLNCTVAISKQGYLSKNVPYSQVLDQWGVIRLSDELDMNLAKIEVGADLASLIDILPIYFDYAKFAIRPDAAKELDKIVKIMNEYPTMVIELGSHTDCRGSMAANLSLSDKRAKASAAYVKARITNPNRIYGKGYGETKLKNDCACEGPVKPTCSEEVHQENRRTEFIIIKM